MLARRLTRGARAGDHASVILYNDLGGALDIEVVGIEEGRKVSAPTPVNCSSVRAGYDPGRFIVLEVDVPKGVGNKAVIIQKRYAWDDEPFTVYVRATGKGRSRCYAIPGSRIWVFPQP